MLVEVVREIAAKLASVPVTVSYDEDALEQSLVTTNRIRVTEGPDSFGLLGQQGGKDRIALFAAETMIVVIEAASTVDGASKVAHRRLAKDIRDAFLVALQRVIVARNCELLPAMSGAFENDGAVETGARYVLTVGYRRGINAAVATTITDPTITTVPTVTVDRGDTTQASC